jgi:hypothetical protein
MVEGMEWNGTMEGIVILEKANVLTHTLPQFSFFSQTPHIHTHYYHNEIQS